MCSGDATVFESSGLNLLTLVGCKHDLVLSSGQPANIVKSVVFEQARATNAGTQTFTVILTCSDTHYPTSTPTRVLP